MWLYSSPEPKAQASYWHSALSVRRPAFILTLSTSSQKSLNKVQRNVTGNKISTYSTKFVFCGPIGKRRWPHWPLIGWYIFHFFSETAEQNSTKTCQGARSQCPLPSLFFGPTGRPTWPPEPLIGWDIFDFFYETAERNSTKLDTAQDLNAFYQVRVLRGRSETKDGRRATDWLINFPLLLWNCGTEFNETWQTARSHRPLLSVCFSSRPENEDGRPSLWLAEPFSTSSLKPLNGIQQNLTESKISTFSTTFVFFGPFGKSI